MSDHELAPACLEQPALTAMARGVPTPTSDRALTEAYRIRTRWLGMSFLVLILQVTGCRGSAGDSEPGGMLVSVVPICRFSVPRSDDGERVEISGVAIRYRTANADGAPLTASAGLFYTSNPKDRNLVCYVRGTLLPGEAELSPSRYDGGPRFDSGRGSEIREAIRAFAGSGFVLVMPDLIGYGESAGIAHPYMVMRSMASTSRDAIRAARRACSNAGIAIRPGICIGGYSQGASAGMSLHRLLEREDPRGRPVACAALFAGVYATSATINRFLCVNEDHPAANLYVWAIYNFELWDGPGLPIGTLLNSPFAEHFDWNKPHSIPSNPRITINDAVRTTILRDPSDPLAQGIAANDCFDWTPRAPVWLHHGTADDIAPFFNSQIAFETMRQYNSPVHLVPYLTMDHDQPFRLYLLSACAEMLQVTSSPN